MANNSERKGTISRRRLLAAGLAVGVTAALAACGPAPAAPTAPAKSIEPTKPAAPAKEAAAPAAAKPAAAPGAPTAISFSPRVSQTTVAMWEDIVKQFEAKHPAIKVERRFDPSLTWEKIHVMLGAGTAGSVQEANDDDIFLLLAQRATTGLDDYARDVKRDDYYPTAWTSRVGAGGELGAVVAGSQPLVIIYNVDHFKEAGLTAPTEWKNAWSFEQFNEALQKLVRRDASGKTTRYAYGDVSWFMQQLMENNGAQRYNEDETESLLNKTPAAEEILTWYQGLFVKEKVAVPRTENYTQLFNSGLASMVVSFPNFSLSVKKDLNFDLMPIFKGKLKNMTENTEPCFTIPSSEKAKDQAWTFAHYLQHEDVQTAFVKTDFAVPILKRVAEGPLMTDPNRLPKNRRVGAEGVVNDLPSPNNPVGDDYQKWFARTENELVTGQKDAKTFLAERVERLNKALVDTGWNRKSTWVKGWTPGANVPLLIKPTAVPGKEEPAKPKP